MKKIKSSRRIKKITGDENFSSKKRTLNQTMRVFSAILALMKKTGGIDKVLRVFQYLGYIQRVRMKALLESSKLQGKVNFRISASRNPIQTGHFHGDFKQFQHDTKNFPIL